MLDAQTPLPLCSFAKSAIVFLPIPALLEAPPPPDPEDEDQRSSKPESPDEAPGFEPGAVGLLADAFVADERDCGVKVPLIDGTEEAEALVDMEGRMGGDRAALDRDAALDGAGVAFAPLLPLLSPPRKSKTSLLLFFADDVDCGAGLELDEGAAWKSSKSSPKSSAGAALAAEAAGAGAGSSSSKENKSATFASAFFLGGAGALPPCRLPDAVEVRGGALLPAAASSSSPASYSSKLSLLVDSAPYPPAPLLPLKAPALKLSLPKPP